MTDFLKAIDYPPVVISTLTTNSIGLNLARVQTGFTMTSAAIWFAANTANFIPFRIGYVYTAATMFWINGATVGTNSVDVGIYDPNGNRLVSSGSTTTSGASSIQSVSISSTTLQPGLYYLAMVMNGTTDNVIMNSMVPGAERANGVYQMASAFALPSTATFTGFVTASKLPFIGVSSKAVI